MRIRFFLAAATAMLALFSAATRAEAGTITYTPPAGPLNFQAGDVFQVTVTGASTASIELFGLYLHSSTASPFFTLQSFTLDSAYSYITSGPVNQTFTDTVSTTINADYNGAGAAPASTTLGIATIKISNVATPGSYNIGNTVSSVFIDGDFNEDNTTPNSFQVTVVPEPSAWALLGVGAMGMVFAVRRRSLAQA